MGTNIYAESFIGSADSAYQNESKYSLKNLILNLLTYQARYERPIGRRELADMLRRRGALVTRDDRPMRSAIEDLRKDGFLVCHRKGKDGGYYLPHTKDEYEDFRTREYRSRIVSLVDTMKKMDKAAKAKFGEAIQLELFEF